AARPSHSRSTTLFMPLFSPRPSTPRGDAWTERIASARRAWYGPRTARACMLDSEVETASPLVDTPGASMGGVMRLTRVRVSHMPDPSSLALRGVSARAAGAPTPNRRFLFLFSDTGGGHRAAATAMARRLESSGSGQVHLLDPFAHAAPRWVGRLVRTYSPIT